MEGYHYKGVDQFSVTGSATTHCSRPLFGLHRTNEGRLFFVLTHTDTHKQTPMFAGEGRRMGRAASGAEKVQYNVLREKDALTSQVAH
mmetsp:Transcript_136967/g.238102  ORF Transcript_136967/g.238102 Transcript_136967/m.238102 type:complete len:88 (+) Transcript_136967:445-708(+)